MEALHYRLGRGDDVDERDWDTEWTPLMYACKRGSHMCAQALIEANAALDLDDESGCTALMLACDSEHGGSGHLACA